MLLDPSHKAHKLQKAEIWTSTCLISRLVYLTTTVDYFIRFWINLLDKLYWATGIVETVCSEIPLRDHSHSTSFPVILALILGIYLIHWETASWWVGQEVEEREERLNRKFNRSMKHQQTQFPVSLRWWIKCINNSKYAFL